MQCAGAIGGGETLARLPFLPFISERARVRGVCRMREVLLPAGEVDKSTPEKVIRVQGSASHGGYRTMPNRIVSRVRTELRGAEKDVFSYIWTRTTGFQRFERQIPISEFVENSTSQERSIGDALLRLEKRDWITIRRNGNRPNIYGVDLRLLEDYGCLENLPTDGGESPEDLPVEDGKSASANFADQTPAPKDQELRKSLNKNTHDTPLNRSGVEAENEHRLVEEEGCEGAVLQPEIPEQEIREQECEAAYRSYFDPHHETGEPKEQDRRRFDSQPEIGPDPLSQKLKYCGMFRRNILKVTQEYSADYLWAVVRNFEADMREEHNVKSFPGVLSWRIRNGVVSWEKDSWVSAAQGEFDEWITVDKSRLLGVLECAALEQNLELGSVMRKLDLHGVSYGDMRELASIQVRSDFHD